MSENRRKRRLKEKSKVQTEKTVISKRDKIIWIGVIIIFVLFVLFILLLLFLKYFITI